MQESQSIVMGLGWESWQGQDLQVIFPLVTVRTS